MTDLPKLQPKDSIRIQMNGEWVPGTVKGLAGTPRSYIVVGPAAGGREYQQNCRHLRKTVQYPTKSTDVDDDDIAIQPVVQEALEQPSVTQPAGQETFEQPNNSSCNLKKTHRQGSHKVSRFC